MYTQRRTTPAGAPIPQNYSGNAFRYPPIGSLGQDTADEPMLSLPAEPPMTVAPSDEATVEPREELKESYPPVLDGSKPSVSASSGLSSLFGGLGFGHEELLLLGLCLLLSGDGSSFFSRAGRGGDILPYLMLLLICG